MAPLHLRIRIKPKSLTLNPLQALRHFSSSSRPFPDQDHNPYFNGENKDDASSSPPRSSPSSMVSEIKEFLRSPQVPPCRIHNDPPLPPIAPPDHPPPPPLDEIRKHLGEFRLRSSTTSNPNPSHSPIRGPSEDRHISFQELFKRNALNNCANRQDTNSRTEGNILPYETIRESFRKIRPSTERQTFQGQRSNASGPSLIGDQTNLPENIFGREMREKEGGDEGDVKVLKTELVKTYGNEELGEKLRRLRPEAAEKGKKDWFSLDELNLRLAKLRELESRRGGGTNTFSDLKMSLIKLKSAEDSKKANMTRLSILAGIGTSSTHAYMLQPPQEHLLENYFHPDHMASSEKMKLELKKVRDEFKLSESDCGSSRVQMIMGITFHFLYMSSLGGDLIILSLKLTDGHNRVYW